MQNSNTGIFGTSVPVTLVPSPPRWPSWKTQTSAPNAAVSDKTLSSNAFNGSTTLRVSRNSCTKVTIAITPSTIGRRELIAAALSRVIWAIPVSWTRSPEGPGTACNLSSWVSEAAENSVALLDTVRKALPSAIPVAAVGGPTRTPPT